MTKYSVDSLPTTLLLFHGSQQETYKSKNAILLLEIEMCNKYLLHMRQMGGQELYSIQLSLAAETVAIYLYMKQLMGNCKEPGILLGRNLKIIVSGLKTQYLLSRDVCRQLNCCNGSSVELDLHFCNKTHSHILGRTYLKHMKGRGNMQTI